MRERIDMQRKLISFRLVVLMAIIIIAGFSLQVSTALDTVDYTKNITDTQGDVDSVNADNYSADADIITLKSSESDGIITIELTVLGTIHTTVDGEYDEVRYEFFIDINPPAAADATRYADWMLTIYLTSYQTLMYLVDNDGEFEYNIPEEDVSGGGTQTLKVNFPVTHITDEILGWDIKGMTEIALPGDTYYYTEADDDTSGSWTWEYGGGGPDDSDYDGMPDDYEDDNGLDKNDPTDAQDDNDGDGFSNLIEYIEETDPNDEVDYPSADNGNGVDPSTETPTDTSIKVEITISSWVYENKSGYVYIDETVKGTTNGVDHCEILYIMHFNDGTKDEDYYWTAGYENDDYKWGDTEFTYDHFKETSPNWMTWEYRVKGKVKITSETNTDRYPTKAEVYVRAFKDETDQNWNQVTKLTTVVIKGLDGTDGVSDGDGDTDGDDDSGGFLPGFESIFALVAIAIALIVLQIYRRK